MFCQGRVGRELVKRTWARQPSGDILRSPATGQGAWSKGPPQGSFDGLRMRAPAHSEASGMSIGSNAIALGREGLSGAQRSDLPWERTARGWARCIGGHRFMGAVTSCIRIAVLQISPVPGRSELPRLIGSRDGRLPGRGHSRSLQPSRKSWANHGASARSLVPGGSYLCLSCGQKRRHPRCCSLPTFSSHSPMC